MADPNSAQPVTRLAQPAQAAIAPADTYRFDLDGGRACLDFANTRSSSGEHLTSYFDLVAFASQSELLTPADVEWLQAEAERDRTGAQAVLGRAIRLREALKSIFSSLAAGQPPAHAGLEVLNGELAASLGHARVQPADTVNVFVWGWRDRALDLPL